ncbi:hypothetical protein B7R87_31620 [Streptomyces tsukubensis]|uniref:Uncharacterized protein n=1 Tax=Streptomyces tsukubensis (strain DSM 42081 / NBRC 108919 / NRRL 18488 / 9993) TaxID=1114943 RepID=I2NAX0_STRT9|nr:hypothetical protein B7R87_31620 [Streptomyces tsukubensis]EIF94167.1 hypothetical protein [Streptomyces tsukubensis NRRL18488]QKM66138.1 hypothetical protein STSU_002155 [Streptomyces tsukubensis NRRL18488]
MRTAPCVSQQSVHQGSTDQPSKELICRMYDPAFRLLVDPVPLPQGGSRRSRGSLANLVLRGRLW